MLLQSESFRSTCGPTECTTNLVGVFRSFAFVSRIQFFSPLDSRMRLCQHYLSLSLSLSPLPFSLPPPNFSSSRFPRNSCNCFTCFRPVSTPFDLFFTFNRTSFPFCATLAPKLESTTAIAIALRRYPSYYFFYSLYPEFEIESDFTSSNNYFLLIEQLPPHGF